MPKGENQKQKLIRLLEIFYKETDEDCGLTMAEIIDRLYDFGITAERKSIYDDIKVLEAVGFFITKDDARPPRYKLEERLFELAELKMLVDAIQASKFITAKKSREIIRKLEVFAGVNKARELSRQVYVEDRAKTVNPSAIYSIDAIHTAINTNKRLSFKYFDYDGEKNKVLRHGGNPYDVSPIVLAWDDEKYYLVAFDETAGKIKNFRVDKMQSVSILEGNRSQRQEIADFDPAAYSMRIFGMYGGRDELVTIECREKLASAMIDRFGTEPTFIKTEFGFKFSIRLTVSPIFFSWLVGFGEDIKVISPASVQEEFVSSLQRIAGIYGK